MNVKQMIDAVRDNARDFNGTIFNQGSIIRYINECSDRISQVLYELDDIPRLEADNHVPDYLPKRYHNLYVMFVTGRCFTQDGDYGVGVSYMNEFELKLEELRYAIDSGDAVLPEGCGIVRHERAEYVNHYYNSHNRPRHNTPCTDTVCQCGEC